MRQNAHNMREAMALEQWQKLKGLHLKGQTGIDHKQNNISYFREIDHGGDVIGALHDGDSLFFVGAEGDGACDFIYFVFGVVFY